MIRKYQGIAAVALGLGVVAATATISSGAGPDTQTMKGGVPALAQSALKTMHPSTSEREALNRAISTGQVDKTDYKKANLAFRKCMTAQGFHPKFRESSKGFFVELPYKGVEDEAALDEAYVVCSEGTDTVQDLYRIQQANPKLLTDQRLVAVQCLKGGGYAMPGYSAGQFERDFEAGQFPFDAEAKGPNDCLYGAGYSYFTADGR